MVLALLRREYQLAFKISCLSFFFDSLSQYGLMMKRLQEFGVPMSKKKRIETRQKQHDLDEELENVSPFNRVLDIIFAMSSCILFAISSLLVKLLGEIPSQEVVFFRSLVLPPLIYGKVPIIGNAKDLPFLCVRGVAGTLALCCQFYAFQHMPLADATAIVFSSPVFTGVLAYFLLGETWGLFDVLATLWCFSGVVLIARPTFLFSRAIGNTEQESNWEQVKEYCF